MLLLDRVLAYDGECVTCETVLRPDSPFAEHGQVPAIVGIEYMAQTIAAGAGLRARDSGAAGGRMGFLLGCRSLVLVVESFDVGDRLTIEARRAWGANELGNFACKVQRGEDVLVEGALTVYQGPLPEDQEMPR
jgi:predicted hotdog family 3-hydroxylacyl-ACP dehydratase